MTTRWRPEFDPNYLYFVTTKAVGYRHLFQRDIMKRIVADAMYTATILGSSRLYAFVIMPNHVHVLFRPLDKNRLADILKSWKGFTAYEINKHIGRSGTLWQEEYWDRLIRDEQHFLRCATYIRSNPVKGGLREREYVFENYLENTE